MSGVLCGLCCMWCGLSVFCCVVVCVMLHVFCGVYIPCCVCGNVGGVLHVHSVICVCWVASDVVFVCCGGVCDVCPVNFVSCLLCIVLAVMRVMFSLSR